MKICGENRKTPGIAEVGFKAPAMDTRVYPRIRGNKLHDFGQLKLARGG